ncbi:MAG: c-type cytochrome [Nitrospinae bacterium]|nr:c-type cytochrome [Nitrospinota bacterium]
MQIWNVWKRVVEGVALVMLIRVAGISLLNLLLLAHSALGGQHPKPPPAKPMKVQALSKGDPKLGESVYKEICFSCHGEAGDGKGPSWLNSMPRPQVFTDSNYMARLTDQYMFEVVKYGKLSVLKREHPSQVLSVPMPGFETALTDSQVKALISFERAFTSGLPQAPETRSLFEQHCAVCHGQDGRGTGVMASPVQPAPQGFVSMIQPAPADYTNRRFMERFNDDFLFWLIKKGRIGVTEEKGYDTMRPYGHVLSDEEIWSVIRYIRETFIEPNTKR